MREDVALSRSPTKGRKAFGNRHLDRSAATGTRSSVPKANQHASIRNARL